MMWLFIEERKTFTVHTATGIPVLCEQSISDNYTVQGTETTWNLNAQHIARFQVQVRPKNLEDINSLAGKHMLRSWFI